MLPPPLARALQYLLGSGNRAPHLHCNIYSLRWEASHPLCSDRLFFLVFSVVPSWANWTKGEEKGQVEVNVRGQKDINIDISKSSLL